MECHEARLLIDERVHGSLKADLSAQLDGHLKNCVECREDLRQLEKTRELLAAAKNDAPSELALAGIWQAVAAATQTETTTVLERKRRMTPSISATAVLPSKTKAAANTQRTHWKLVAASSLVAAAVPLGWKGGGG